MKTYSIIMLMAIAFALGSCSSAYRSAQTPDAVYYSPTENNGAARSSGDQQVVAQGDNPDDGQYVVYDDGSYGDGIAYPEDYDFGYRGGYSNLYALNSYSMGYPYMGTGYSSLWNYSMGWPSFSLGLNWGSPFGRWYNPYAYNMMYSPFSYGMMYSPFSYGMMYNPYSFGGYPYYPGYYGYGGGYMGIGYGKYSHLNPRPAISWAPRRSVISNAGAYRGSSSSPGVSTSPRRVFTTQGTTGTVNTGTSSPRRVFKAKPGEQPVNINNGRTVQTQQPARTRIFRSNRSSNTQQRTETQQRPSRETRVFQQPTRSFESNNTPSTPTRSSSTPARTFSPRGR